MYGTLITPFTQSFPVSIDKITSSVATNRYVKTGSEERYTDFICTASVKIQEITIYARKDGVSVSGVPVDYQITGYYL